MDSSPSNLRRRLHRFRPRLLDDLRAYDGQRFATDCGAGLTVGVVALPLAMAFAIASGVKPEQGIFTAIVAGFLISALGGSSVQIGGPAGAFIVIVYGIVQRYGVANLLVATVLAGVLQFALGIFRLGALIRYIPVSVIIGFTNGIAVLIALSQAKDLLGLRFTDVPADFASQTRALLEHAHELQPTSLVLGLTCLGGLVVWSRLAALALPPGEPPAPRSAWPALALRAATRIPGPIVALVSLSFAAAAMDLPVETIGTRFGGVPAALPSLEWPSFDWASVQRLVVPTITLALLGAIESLLCARVADGMADLRPHDPNQELMAQGIANAVAPFFGGIPATGTIARTMTNVRAGASSPVAGMVHATTLLGIVLVAAPLASRVPLAVLSGVLLHVAWNMGDWQQFRRLRAFAFEYRAKLVCTFLLTVLVDLTVAVEVGLAIACAVFVYRMSQLFQVEVGEDSSCPRGTVLYRLHGPLFFGAVDKIEALADRVPPGTRVLTLDASDLLSIDVSGLSSLENLQRALGRKDTRLEVVNADARCLSALRQAGLGSLIG